MGEVEFSEPMNRIPTWDETAVDDTNGSSPMFMVYRLDRGSPRETRWTARSVQGLYSCSQYHALNMATYSQAGTDAFGADIPALKAAGHCIADDPHSDIT